VITIIIVITVAAVRQIITVVVEVQTLHLQEPIHLADHRREVQDLEAQDHQVDQDHLEVQVVLEGEDKLK
jgi:hypothetical protein